jgi:hypothetical protein
MSDVNFIHEWRIYPVGMRHGIFHFALAATIIGHAIAPSAIHARDRETAMSGDRQQAAFATRLERMADAIDRRRRDGVLSAGQADFMRQDLDRVWWGVTRTVRDSGALTPHEQATYAAMLRRVDLRIVRADARRNTR